MEQEHKLFLEKAIKAQGDFNSAKSVIKAIQNEKTSKSVQKSPSKLSIALDKEKMKNKIRSSFSSDGSDT